MKRLTGKLEFVSKKNFNREKPRRRMKSGKPGSYYAALGKAPPSGHSWKPIQPRMSEAEKQHQRIHVARYRLIKEIVEG